MSAEPSAGASSSPADAPRRRHDVAIYVASAGTAGFYDGARARAGGAERQMTLLARALAEHGRRVAHVTFRPVQPVSLSYPLTLVFRDEHRGGLGGLLEARAVWRALAKADAVVVVLRSASPALGVAALYCRIRRRRLVFSSSNISDFTLERMPGRFDRMLYRLGLRLADVVVVQSGDQIDLASGTASSLRRVVRIPSFAETGGRERTRSDQPAFLWFGRAVPQKHPLKYVELARSVPEARFRMIPVPDGPDPALLEEVRAAAQHVSNLEVLDPLPHAELQRLLASSVAVVNTSSLEGMPNAFLEAWACGVPSLTLEFDPDAVVEREGLGVSCHGSWPRFLEGARDLWKTREDRTELSRRTRAYVEREHSVAAVAARWEALLDDVRGGSRPAPQR